MRPERMMVIARMKTTNQVLRYLRTQKWTMMLPKALAKKAVVVNTIA